MAAVAQNLSRTCHAGVDDDTVVRYSADVSSGVSTTPLRLDTQADSGPIAAPQRDTAPSKNYIDYSSATTAVTVTATARGDRLSRTMPAHRPHPHR